MSAYEDLIAFQRETEALSSIAGRLGWDQETVMPGGAAEQRGEEMGAIAKVLHSRRSDPRVGEWLAAADSAGLEDSRLANLRRIGRDYRRATRVPADLAAEIARLTSIAQGIWAEARRNEDFESFAPSLARVVDLKRSEAAALADGGNLYDSLLDEFEPGMTGAELETMFGALRPRLANLRERIFGAERRPGRLSGEFDETGQMTLARELAETFGYDFRRGRIDKAVHPFSSGSGDDVRITTRTSREDPFNCIYSTIHEVGHATYEQGIDSDYAMTPLGQGASMGVHESQSRIYENQLGRSRAFAGHLFARMRAVFGDFGISDAEAFYGVVNRVDPGFIRTEADEVHYNLHVMMRFDLERAIIAGDLDVVDLPEAWNARFLDDFGARVDRPSDGCLQDIHWSVGLFGYFPTYALGNVYAGCLERALREALPGLDRDLAGGDVAAAVGWLRERLQRHGGLREPRDAIAHACGFEPTEEPLLDYIETKFGDLYDL